MVYNFYNSNDYKKKQGIITKKNWEKWIFQPKIFDLGSQNYTPDFYLPDYNIYIEVKNFLWKYSKIRDRKFRKLYPNIKLILLLKKNYLRFEKQYSQFIKNWEYKNSPFLSDNKTVVGSNPTIGSGGKFFTG